MVAFELLPRRQGGGVDDTVEEQPAVEVVAFVLEGAGGEPPLDLVVLVPVPVEPAGPDVDVPQDGAPQVGDRQATLVDLDQLVVERLDDRVDQDRERDRRLVRVPRVVVDLDDRHPDRLVDLVGGDPGAVGVAHRVDQVVDQPLQLRRGQLGRRDLAGALAEDGMTDRGDRADRHRPMMPRRTRRPWFR